jgi:hypothetical protein
MRRRAERRIVERHIMQGMSDMEILRVMRNGITIERIRNIRSRCSGPGDASTPRDRSYGG